MILRPEERFSVMLNVRNRYALRADVIAYAVEAGITFTGTKAQRIRAWERLKNKGVMPSVPDWHFFWVRADGQPDYGTLELKFGKNDTSDGQDEHIDRVRKMGFHADVAWCFADVERHLTAWGVPLIGRYVDLDQQLLAAVPASVKKPKACPGRRVAKKPTQRGLRFDRTAMGIS